MRRATRPVLLALAAALGSSEPSFSEEHSKFRFALTTASGGDERGTVLWEFWDGGATLRVRVKNLDAGQFFDVYVNDSANPVAQELTDRRGAGEVLIDLRHLGTDTRPIPDPRGVEVAVADRSSPGSVPFTRLIANRLYADPDLDPPKLRLREETSLARVGAAQGEARAVYRTWPSGVEELAISLVGVAAGDYSVSFAGGQTHVVTADASGNARVVLRTSIRNNEGGAGTSRASKRRAPLVGNPRAARIEISRAAQLEFAGPMLAQISRLNVCAPTSVVAPFEVNAPLWTEPGTVAFGYEANCDVHLSLTGTLPAGDFEIYVGGSQPFRFNVADEGGGVGALDLAFEEFPDAGESWIPGDTRSGAVLSIVSADDGTPYYWVFLP
jgi:hypothetical protein